MALNLLEGFDLASLDPLSPERLHLQIEALRLAFADSRWYVSDPQFSKIPLSELLSKEYAAERRKLINPKAATLNQVHGRPFTSSDTVYFCVVDQWGNACSFINSNYMGFGTGIVPKGGGFTLQNRGYNFSLDPQHPNVLAPGKRPYHTIIPAMVTKLVNWDAGKLVNREIGRLKEDNQPGSQSTNPQSTESLFAAFGVMGGFMQPQGHVQVFLALMDGLDPQSALELPRFCIEDGNPSDAVALEEGIPLEAMAKLAEMGHPIRPVSGWERALFGRGQVITRDNGGALAGGSDPRADGCVMTLV